MDKTLRDRVARHAKSQGFSSIQDYTRVLYSTAVEQDLRFSLRYHDETYLSPEAEARYAKQLEEHEVDRKAGKVKSFDSVEDFLADLKRA